MSNFFPYTGGKDWLKADILRLIPAHYRYVEPFVGSGAVFFAKQRSKIEIINDRDDLIINLYRQVAGNCAEFLNECKELPSARTIYTEFLKELKEKGTFEGRDLDRAVKIFYLLCAGWLGQPKGGYRISEGNNWNEKRFEIVWNIIQKRLEGVHIENLDFEDVCKRNDHEDTLLYLDPPYFSSPSGSSHYLCKFTKEDHLRLVEMLKAFKGKFILSYDACDRIKELYKNFHLQEISVKKYKLSTFNENQEENKFGELIITNFEQKGRQGGLWE